MGDELELAVDELADGEGGSADALERLPWAGETTDIAQAMRERARAYGSYFNRDRALPDIRDGLKPVQRRILFGMAELGLRHDRPYKKSALAVGAVMGNYHPHGDAAIYDAMVRMAQPFVMNAPLIDGQGNFGSVDGDPAAAQRYTEARLTKLASECLADLHPEIVRYRPNFSETKEEATVLPMTFPNLLVNGAKGIGWAMAVEIPPHNLAEAIDAAILLAENPQATLKQLLRKLPGPDFPSGGIIVNPEALPGCYETGRGTVMLQARYQIENLPGNQQAVVVTELPYMVGPDKIVEQVVAAARAEKITEVTEMPRNLSDKNGVRLLIKCKRGGNVAKLVADLMRYTSLRQTVPFNFTVLIGRTPKVVSLRELLEHFVAFRLEVVSKRLQKERRDLERSLRRDLALLAALDVIDRVVKIVRASRDDADSKAQLIALLKYRPHGQRKLVPIDEEQAQWIIEMQIRRLNQLNRFELEEAAARKGRRIDEIDRLLASESGVRDIVVQELREVKRAYGRPRRTALSGEVAIQAQGDGAQQVAVVTGPAEDVTLYVSDAGLATAQGGKRRAASVPLRLGGSSLVAVLETRSDETVLAFSERGICYKATLADLPSESGKTKGRPLVGLARGDRLAAVLPSSGYSHLALVTAGGELKRIALETVQNAHAGGIAAFKVPDGDRIVAVVPHGEEGELLISTAGGQALRLDLAKVRPVQTGAAGGVAGIALKEDDSVADACLLTGDQLLVVHAAGHAKRVPLSDYPQKGRATAGVLSSQPDKPTRAPGGPIVAALCLTGEETELYLSSGRILPLTIEAIELGKRATVAKPALELGQGERPFLAWRRRRE
jgi:DNA gyrase subunit A